MELPAPARKELSSRVHRYWVIDRRRRRQGIVLQTGDEHWLDIEEGEQLLQSQLDVTVFDWDRWWVFNSTKRGDWIISEVYSPISTDPVRGRSVVYLDQNHWSTLAKVMVDPSLVKRKSEVEPALELVRLTEDARIILPLSSANLRETSALFGDKRYELGVAMAQLAGGWQIRHPLQTRVFELVNVLAPELGTTPPKSTARPVVTLEPYAALMGEPDAGLLEPSDLELFKLAHTSFSALIEVLLDPDPIPSAALDTWTSMNQRVTDMLRDSTFDKKQKRMYSYISTWTDLGESLLLALKLLGRRPGDLERIAIGDIPRICGSARMLGLYSDIAMRRHTNRDTRWVDNDLTDMMYLSCASAYVDFVAAERRTTEDLRQANQALGRTNNVYPTIESLVAALQSTDARTDPHGSPDSSLRPLVGNPPGAPDPGKP